MNVRYSQMCVWQHPKLSVDYCGLMILWEHVEELTAFVCCWNGKWTAENMQHSTGWLRWRKYEGLF